MKAAVEQFANKQNDLVQARERLQSAIDQIVAAPLDVQSDFMIKLLIQDLETAKAGLQSTKEYHSSGNMYLTFKSQAYREQRCAESSPNAACAFRSSMKKSTAEQFVLPKKK